MGCASSFGGGRRSSARAAPRSASAGPPRRRSRGCISASAPEMISAAPLALLQDLALGATAPPPRPPPARGRTAPRRRGGGTPRRAAPPRWPRAPRPARARRRARRRRPRRRRPACRPGRRRRRAARHASRDRRVPPGRAAPAPRPAVAATRRSSADGHRLVVDEGAGAAVGLHHAAQHQRVLLQRDALLLQDGERRMVGGRQEARPRREHCAWPARTSPPSARAPQARPRLSSRMDLPAPVSPVSTVRPGPKDRSSRSISTTSRMAREASIGVCGSAAAPRLGGGGGQNTAFQARRSRPARCGSAGGAPSTSSA